MRKKLLETALAAAVFFSLSSMANDATDFSRAGPHQPSVGINVDTSIALNAEEEADLAFMREEEKLARDVYLYLSDLWGARVFANIADAEQQHMDSVKVLLDAYQLTDPAVADRGFFTDPDLQGLYDQLIAKGSVSLEEALKVGALIEEVDIDDLYRAINDTRNPAIIQMYSGLLNGSYRHLNSFVEQLGLLGMVYSAQVLSADEVTSILDGETFSAVVTDAAAITADGTPVATESRFSPTLLRGGISQDNGISVSGTETLTSASYIIPQAADVGSQADYLIVVSYLDTSGTQYFFMRNGASWESWDGNLQTLSSAARTTLGNMQYLEIFSGQLAGLEGEFNIFVGYRLANGTIVYSPQPINFTITN